MGTNDFLKFAAGGGALVVSQATYAAAAALLANGYQVGIADPSYLNKTWRQSSIMAQVIGDLIVTETGLNVVDDGTTATILANLITAIQAITAGVNNSVAAITTTGGTTMLSAAQYGARFIVLTGVLTSNASIIFPAAYGSWTVINNTTGAFTLSCFASGGGGVPVPQGAADSIICDGSNVRFALRDGITQSLGDSSNALATTAFAQGVAAVNQPRYLTTSGGLVAGVYLADTTAGSFTGTLPAAPARGTVIEIFDPFGSWFTNNFIVDPNGKSILFPSGVISSGVMNCDLTGEDFKLIYDGTYWRLQ